MLKLVDKNYLIIVFRVIELSILIAILFTVIDTNKVANLALYQATQAENTAAYANKHINDLAETIQPELSKIATNAEKAMFFSLDASQASNGAKTAASNCFRYSK